MEGGISKVLRGQGVGRRTKRDSLATRLWIIQKHTLEVMEEKWAFDTGAPEGAIQMVPVMLKVRRRGKGSSPASSWPNTFCIPHSHSPSGHKSGTIFIWFLTSIDLGIIQGKESGSARKWSSFGNIDEKLLMNIFINYENGEIDEDRSSWIFKGIIYSLG